MKLTIKHAVRELRIFRGAYAWPGGYEIILVYRGGVVCQQCLEEMYLDDLRDIVKAIRKKHAAVYCMDMIEEDLYCDCGYCYQNPYAD